MERRHSTTSDSSTDSSHTRQSSSDYVETPVGRTAKATTPKPPANALQFVKTGPADLYRSAQEQLKKVEELKKAKKHIPEEAEDWQSNLDNWKCSRRKRQEHIIERVVEVKKLELEEHERNRRRSKTFNEMIQDRNIRGRKTSLPIYQDDDSNNLLDLGLSNIEKSDAEEINDTENEDEEMEKVPNGNNHSSEDNFTREDNSEKKFGIKSNGFKRNKSDVRVSPNSETEEYTYERAIQSYVNFAETRVKSRSTRSITEDKTLTNGFSKEPPPIPVKTRHYSSPRIESSITQIERKKSVSTNELTSDSIKKQFDLPKVDISKRKELFEKISDYEEVSKRPNRTSSELQNGKSIKERLSSLKEHTESTKVQSVNKMSTEISVKDRLTNIERLNSNEDKPLADRRSSDQLTSQTIKERLSNLEKVINVPSKVQTTIEPTVTIKERLSSLKSACNKEQTEEMVTNDKISSFQNLEISQECYQVQNESYDRSFSPEEIYENKRQQHYRHRSLDSLDVDSNSNEAFERVQSLEDLEYCRNYPASTFSGDTDREDSGIHTADVSSSVSQADDYDLHLETNGIIDDIKAHHQPTIVEEMKHYQADSFSYGDTNHQDKLETTEATKCETEQESVEKVIVRNNETDVTSVVNSVHYENETTNLKQIKNPPNCQSGILHDSFNFIEHTVENESNSNFIQSSVDIKQTFNQELFIPSEDVQMGELFVHLNIDQEVEGVFQLSPSTLEPPKEKPPPPPKDISDDDGEKSNPTKSTSLRRLDSTKRIKKEIRQKRSSFLGIEAQNDDSYLDPDLELIRPPDMTTLLAEERRMERQLYRQSVCSESDSNQESRDSGVELDNKNQDAGWSHSRNDSETFGNQSTTSEEDEIMRKEREIIETLEQEERIRKQDLGEKLALRLRQLEAEKGREEWERSNQGDPMRSHVHHPVHEHNLPYSQVMDTTSGTGKSDCILQEPLKDIYRCEQERIGPERQHQHTREGITLEEQWYTTRSSLQDISHKNQLNGCHEETRTIEYPKEYRNSLQDLTDPGRGRNTVSHGQSMPDLHQVAPSRPPPPLPVLPPKPRALHPPNDSQTCPQQMTRQTLHALSAVPRSRLISNDIWQVKRKPRQDSYNYQHWLIQEAEHRRITEQQQRQMIPPKPNLPKHSFNQWVHTNRPYSSHPHQPTYTSVPPQTPQQWNHQHRDSKPLPDSIIQTLTQRVQNRMNVADTNNNRRRYENNHIPHDNHQEKMLSVSGKKRCSHCGEELGRGAAMIIESLRLFYHIDCFKCCVCCMQLGDGLMGTDVRVRNNKLHCHNCYSSDDGIKFSCV